MKRFEDIAVNGKYARVVVDGENVEKVLVQARKNP